MECVLRVLIKHRGDDERGDDNDNEVQRREGGKPRKPDEDSGNVKCGDNHHSNMLGLIADQSTIPTCFFTPWCSPHSR